MPQTTEVVVTGMGLMTGLGQTAAATWQKLRAGESAIALRQPFLDLAPQPLAMISKQPYSLDTLVQQVVQAAWTDAGLPPINPPPLPIDSPLHRSSFIVHPSDTRGLGADCGIVIGSSRSHLQTWEAIAVERQGDRFLGDHCPGDWMRTLPHAPALAAARMVGSSGPLLAPMAACATGVWAIAQAADLIRGGQCSRVIAGAVESPITPLTLTGFGKMGALASTGCYPFDLGREGFVLGEGGAVLVLESADLAAQRGARVYGRILAAGITNDGHHVSSFDPSYGMGQRAVALCLQRSGLMSADIDAVHVHGTSTAQNDRMEASLVAQVWDRNVPVMASKGATGHTLGASGALTVALSLLSLAQQVGVPCVGLRSPDFDLNFVREARAMRLENLLCFSFGFGGQNAVLALARG